MKDIQKQVDSLEKNILTLCIEMKKIADTVLIMSLQYRTQQTFNSVIKNKGKNNGC